MKRDVDNFAVAMILLLPFVVAGAFWLTPWIGWPMAFVGAVLWVGSYNCLNQVDGP